MKRRTTKVRAKKIKAENSKSSGGGVEMGSPQRRGVRLRARGKGEPTSLHIFLERRTFNIGRNLNRKATASCPIILSITSYKVCLR